MLVMAIALSTAVVFAVMVFRSEALAEPESKVTATSDLVSMLLALIAVATASAGPVRVETAVASSWLVLLRSRLLSTVALTVLSLTATMPEPTKVAPVRMLTDAVNV